MTQNPEVGAGILVNTISGTYPHPHSLPFDPDSAVIEALHELEYSDPAAFVRGETENIKTLRARIRYLACLWPDASYNDVVHRIHGLLNNRLFTVEDLRIIMNGQSLSDPTRRTNEIPLVTLQAIGRCLRDGMSMRKTARECRVSYGTVEAIEEYLGILSAVKNRKLDLAVDAVRGGSSIRRFSKAQMIPQTSARRLFEQAHDILVELGEIQK